MADPFLNAKRTRGREVTNCSVPRQDQVTGTESYFAKSLEISAATVREGHGMPTVQNLSEVQKKCGVRGRTKLHERESMMNENKNPVEGGGRALKRVERGWHHSTRQKPSRGSRGGGGVDHDFSGVEISIAGGVEEMVCV